MTAFRGSISDATPKQHVLASALPGTEKRGRPKLPHSRGQNWLGGVIGGILGLIILSPAIGWAHGELLIRIDEVTQRIVAATNTPERLAPLYVERGDLYREDENWEEAEADFNRAAALAPHWAAVDFFRGKLRAATDQLEAARALFDKVLARDANDGAARVERARVLVRLKELPLAEADFQRGATLLAEPEPEVFVEWAQVLITEGRTNDALRALDMGIQKLGVLPPLQTLALDLEVGRRNYPQALKRLETLHARAMRKEGWQARRGDILRAMGRDAEAKTSYAAALVTIKALPPRIQQGPAMTDLRARVQAALAELGEPPAHNAPAPP